MIAAPLSRIIGGFLLPRRLALLLLALGSTAWANGMDSIRVDSYFGKGFGRLIDVECRILPVEPPEGYQDPAFILFKKGVESIAKNRSKGLEMHPLATEFRQEIADAVKKDPTAVFKLRGHESVWGWGEPVLTNPPAQRDTLRIAGLGWHLNHYFVVRKIEAIPPEKAKKTGPPEKGGK